MSEFRQADVDPKELSFLNDREEDNCRELVKVADLTGGDWPQLARQAVRSMKMRSKPEDDIWGIYCWPTFGTCTRPNWRVRKSEERIHRIAFFQRIWTNSCTISKKDPGATGRTGRARGRLLNKYEIRTETLRVEQEKGNGYRWKAFFSAWDSYLEDDSDDVSEPNAHISPPSHPPTGAIFVFSRRQSRPVKVPGQNPASRSRLQIPPSWGNSNPKNGS